MELEILSKKDDKLQIEVRGENHTLLNILRENAWKTGAKQVSYMIKHPYLSHPKIIIKSGQYKKVLTGAAQMIIDDATAFSKEFKRAVKK
jgi:DNA-directed RNA polymerase subunit L